MSTIVAGRLQDAARENIKSGVLLLCYRMLATALRDPRLQRAHRLVLVSYVECMNNEAALAWPSYETISSMTRLTPKTVRNTVYELREWDYLISEKTKVEQAGGRVLTATTFGNIDHDQIRNEITKYCRHIRENGPSGRAVTAPQEGPTKKANGPSGRAVDGPAGGATAPQEGHQTAPQEGHRNLLKELTRESGAPSETPTPSKQDKVAKASSEETRGTRLSKDWQLLRSWGEWAMTECGVTDMQVREEASKFKDYWIATPGTRGRKSDWEATWRNWCRRAKWEKASPRTTEDAFERELEASIRPGEDRWTARQRLKRLKGIK